jgi:protein SCO1
VCAVSALVVTCYTGCSRAREYELRGQVLAVDRERREITVKHEDIRGFMPGMTMPFKVREGALLEGRKAGELIRATLVVRENDAYLSAIESTGTAPLTEAVPVRRVDALEPWQVVPDVPLVAQDGSPRRLADWRGKPIAVTFTYTRCPLPDFCPLMDRQFSEVQREVLGDAQLRGRVHLLSVSFDPAFDSPAVLAAHAKRVGADPAAWTFVTGDAADVETLAGRFGVSIARGATSAPEIVHNLRTAVIDGRGRLVKVFNGIQWQPSEVAAELRGALGAR